MKSVSKEYVEKEQRYRFNAQAFQSLMNQKKYAHKSAGTRMTKEIIMGEIADKLLVSYEAVKNWAYGYNGPAELEQIIMLGNFFGVDYHDLLFSEDKEMAGTVNTVVANTQAQDTKKYVRKIYKAMLRYLEQCRAWYYHLESFSEDDKKTQNYRIACDNAKKDLQKKFYKADHLLKVSMLDLPKDFYNQIGGYLWGDLIDYMDLIMAVDTDGDWSIDGYSEEQIAKIVEEGKEATEKFFDTGYMTELRSLFADYMVK